MANTAAKSARLAHIGRVSDALCVAALIGILAVFAAGPCAATSERNGKVGAPYEILLGGNPSTGYRWQLNSTASQTLDIVKIEALGYRSAPTGGKVVVGAPAPFAFEITCLKPGVALLAFEYIGPTGQNSGKTEQHRAHCE